MSSVLVKLYYKKRSQFYYWKRDRLNAMGRYTYCVITKVPDPNKGNGGNLATAMLAFTANDGTEYPDSDLYLQDNTYGDDAETEDTPKSRAVTVDDMLKVTSNKRLSFMVPVFTLGEILILNEPDGREIAGRRRAPRKWGIEYEEFSSIRKAAKRAQEVLERNHHE